MNDCFAHVSNEVCAHPYSEARSRSNVGGTHTHTHTHTHTERHKCNKTHFLLQILALFA